MANETATTTYLHPLHPTAPPTWQDILPTILDHLELVTEADRAFLLQASADRWMVIDGLSEQTQTVRLPSEAMQRLRQGLHAFLSWDAGSESKRLEILSTTGADSLVLTPIVHEDRIWGVLGLGTQLQNRIWSSKEREALRNMATLFGARLATEKTMQVYEHLSVVDPITSILNRRGITHQGMRAKQSAEILAVAFIDIDNFKTVNDTYGHSAGDDVLLCISETCQSVLRKKDEIGRWGGDELLVLLPETTSQEAQSVLRRLQKTVHELDWPLLDPDFRMHLSIGLAMYPNEGEDFKSLVEAADERLYQAKRQGGGIIVHAESPGLDGGD